MGKERYGVQSKRWSLRVVQLILELLVAGTPPASINASIAAFVGVITPHIEIKTNKLVLIWFIRRFHTVLLIVCQLLAAHRLSKSEKWGTMHSDGTKRHQVDILNLVITNIEDGDPNYVPIIFSASILLEDGTANSLHDSIINFIDEKKDWLVKWRDVIERDHPE